MTVLVKKISSPKEMHHCLAIRRKVFVEGQKVPLHEEIDGNDLQSEHYLLFCDAIPVGVARVRFVDDTAKIERVAILAEYQGQGLGKEIMYKILADLQLDSSIHSAKLSAQTYAIPFYERLGFKVCSEEYMDANIPHKDMFLSLRQ